MAIRLILRASGLSGIRVGTVDDYQGQEEKVIFISTVISRRHWMHETNTCHLLGSPNKFNVAITRAKALLCIVGNPHILRDDPWWRQMLQHCADHGCCTGTDFSLVDPGAGTQEVVGQIAELALLGSAGEADGGESSTIDLEWRIML